MIIVFFFNAFLLDFHITDTLHGPDNICKQKYQHADACKNAGVRYEFQKKKTGFVVCFYRSENGNESIKADASTDKVRISTDKVRINRENLNTYQKKIFDFIQKNGQITNKQVQELLGVKDSRALKILKELVSMGVILKQGKLKGSYYIFRENMRIDKKR